MKAVASSKMTRKEPAKTKLVTENEKLMESFNSLIKKDEDIYKLTLHSGRGKLFKLYLAGVRKGKSIKK